MHWKIKKVKNYQIIWKQDNVIHVIFVEESLLKIGLKNMKKLVIHFNKQIKNVKKKCIIHMSKEYIIII